MQNSLYVIWGSLTLEQGHVCFCVSGKILQSPQYSNQETAHLSFIVFPRTPSKRHKQITATHTLRELVPEGAFEMLHFKVLKWLFTETKPSNRGTEHRWASTGQQPALELGWNPVFHDIPTLTLASKDFLSSVQLPLLPASPLISAKAWLGLGA